MIELRADTRRAVAANLGTASQADECTAPTSLERSNGAILSGVATCRLPTSHSGDLQPADEGRATGRLQPKGDTRLRFGHATEVTSLEATRADKY